MEPDLPREQEQSIKERKHLLYEDDPSPPDMSRKPFRLYLKETPAAPLSMGAKLLLWGVGLVVGGLLLAAMYRGAMGRPRPEKQPAGKTTSIPAISREMLA